MGPIVRDATSEDLEWLKFHNEQARKIGDIFIASAEKYSDIFTAINVIYVGLLTFIGLASGGVLKNLSFPLSIVFLFPVIFWIAGMYCFLLVKQPFFTEYPDNSPSDIRQALMESNIKKGKYYRNGIICFGFGILLMIIPLIMGLYITAIPEPTTPATNVQLIIGNDHVQYVKQIPIEFVPNTNKTVTVTLVKTAGTDYLILLQNGDHVDINKSWVELVVKK